MPADYLSRLLSTNSDQLAEVTQCFDPFQPELIDLQKAYPDLQKMNHLRTKGEWPAYVTTADGNYLQNLAVKLFQDAKWSLRLIVSRHGSYRRCRKGCLHGI